jgi:uncharacterized protein (DUF3820 family)
MDNYKAVYLKWFRATSFSAGFCDTNVEQIPDDAFEAFAIDRAEWISAAKLPMAKIWREALAWQADAMYAALTGDKELSGLRFPPKIHMNYFPTGDYYSPGQLWIFYKMENNGTTLRVFADLDVAQLLAVAHGDTEGDDVTHPIVHAEMIDAKGNAVRREVDADRVMNFVFPFGKHRGKRIVDVPRDYLEWFSKQPGGGKIADFCRIALELR